MFFNKEKQGQTAWYENRKIEYRVFVSWTNISQKFLNFLVNCAFLDETLDDICISSTREFVTPSDCCRFGGYEKLTQKKVAM